MTDTTKTTKPRKPTFDLNDPALKAIMDQAVATALAAQKAEIMQELAAKPSATNGKSERSMQNEIAVVRAFKKAGFGNVRPHEDARTFNRWVAAGFRPKEGSKAVKVANLRLFCKAQVRPLSSEEKQAMQAELDAVVSANKRKIVSITEAHPQ